MSCVNVIWLNKISKCRRIACCTFTFFIILMIACKQNESGLQDFEGNHYPTRIIGDTEWMIENLRSTKTFTGEDIKYYYPGNDSNLASKFGLLYDYNSATQLCPQGWKIPDNENWESLLSNYKDYNTIKEELNIKYSGAANLGEHPNQLNEKAYYWSEQNNEEFAWTIIFERNGYRKAEQHPEYAFQVRCIKIK